MKLLVVIASYGDKNDAYLARVLSEYRSMPYATDIVVLSNIHKELGPNVEVKVGLPTKDPWSLPFGHRQIFADRQDAYDLFLYSEDDMLVTQRNIEAFLKVTHLLSPQELAGFFQWEAYPDGRLYFPAVHWSFHWRPETLKVLGGYTFAHFTNEHSACYVLTRNQLKQAIASGGFLVSPHEGKYDLLVTAGTDVYTQCGFTKMLCTSHFEDFLVPHLPNRYIGSVLGLDESEFRKQLDALDHMSKNGIPRTHLLEPETKVFHRQWSKGYYESCREDLLALFPPNVGSVLSIGCGWGATEAALVKRGVRVVGLPLDSVIAACAKSRGVEIVYGDIDSAFAQLAGHQFDVVMLSGILHLLQHPDKILVQARSLLSPSGALIANVTNLMCLPLLWRRLRHPSRYRGFYDYQRSGLRVVSRRCAIRWFSDSGLQVENISEVVPREWSRPVALVGELATPLFSSEYVVVARKNTGRTTPEKEQQQ
jgi:2-polyprenyl-3-methyl-5-hydroxy-6-metoxy-1,4-benzoquinol methylase